MLYGLPRRGEGDKATEDAAEDFYQKQLQDFAEQPAAVPGHRLQEVATQLTRVRDDDAVRAAIDGGSMTAQRLVRRRAGLERNRGLLRLVIEAAIWSRGITYHVFRDGDLVPVGTGAAPATR